MNRQQLITMMYLQHRLNAVIDGQWYTLNRPWARAIWHECAELGEHIGWKWWANQESDLKQAGMEVIDITHFGIAIGAQAVLLQDIAEGGNLHEADLDTWLEHGMCHHASAQLEQCLVVSSRYYEEWDLHDLIDDVARHALNGSVAWGSIGALAMYCGMSLEDVYVKFLAKNCLNLFRQANGYKLGTYVKIWDGREDNEWLTEYLEACTLDGVEPSVQGINMYLKHFYTLNTGVNAID